MTLVFYPCFPQLSINMKTFAPILLLLILTNCSPQSEKGDNFLAERIARIENGLQPNLQIQGDSIPSYNIEERLKELGVCRTFWL